MFCTSATAIIYIRACVCLSVCLFDWAGILDRDPVSVCLSVWLSEYIDLNPASSRGIRIVELNFKSLDKNQPTRPGFSRICFINKDYKRHIYTNVAIFSIYPDLEIFYYIFKFEGSNFNPTCKLVHILWYSFYIFHNASVKYAVCDQIIKDRTCGEKWL